MASLLDLNLSYYTVCITQTPPSLHDTDTTQVPAAFFVAFLPHAYASGLAGKNYDLAK